MNGFVGSKMQKKMRHEADVSRERVQGSAKENADLVVGQDVIIDSL
jgi:hypothetical protein